MIRISVVIPLYNKKRTISRAIESVLAQTKLPDEVIVIDDGSSDGSGEVVEGIRNHRLKLVKQENRGVSAARNRGVALSKGNFIAFLDADDVWKPIFLEIMHDLIKRFPKAGAYLTNYEVVNYLGARQVLHNNILADGGYAGLINFFKVGFGGCVTASSIVLQKKIFLEVGGFPEEEHMFEDYDVWVRVALRYPIAWSREISCTIFQNADNHAWSRVTLDKEPKFLETVRNAIQMGLVTPELARDMEEYAAYFHIVAARHFLLQGKREMARTMLAFARDTIDHKKWWWKVKILSMLPDAGRVLLWNIYTNLKN